MYHKHQTEGIILKGYDSGDSSRKVALLSKSLGLVYAHVQNARGLASKLRGNAQEFGLGKFVLVKGAGGWKMVGGEIELSIFQKLKNEPAKLKAVANIFNLVRALVGEGSHAESIHDVLKEFCLKIDAVNQTDIKLAEYAVLLEIMHQLGYLSASESIHPLISRFSLDQESLDLIAENKKAVVDSINQSLRAAHIKI
jgi:DNA repair protein RecO